MRILVIANLYPSKKDPTYGTFVKNFVIGLEGRENIEKLDPCVIKGRSRNGFEKIVKYMCFFAAALYFLLFRKYDIVYNHLTHGIIPIRLVSTIKTLPLVFNLHGEDLLTKTRISAFFLILAKPLLRKAKMIVVPSHFFKNKVVELVDGVKESTIYVSASGGVGVDFYCPSTEKTSNVDTVVGYISRVDRGKGWDVFIEALVGLHNKGLNVRGLIAGNGFQIPQMKELIEKYDAGEYIKYIGAVAYKDLPSIYSQMDLFVFPTMLEESLGLVGLEAMACRIPVAATKIGGITDYLREGINGFYFQKGNVEELSDCIMRFVGLSEEDKSLMQHEAYQTATAYKADVIMDKLYDKLCSIV